MKDYSVVYDNEAMEFASVAKGFLEFLDNAKNMQKDEFIDKLSKLLPLLYLKGALLPKIEEFEDDFTEKFIDEINWAFIQELSSRKLDDDDEYVQVQDIAISNTDDFHNINLSELIADLYQEVGDFLGAYHLGIDQVMLSALYYCKHNFESYWGIRCLVLLKSIHEIRYRLD